MKSIAFLLGLLMIAGVYSNSLNYLGKRVVSELSKGVDENRKEGGNWFYLSSYQFRSSQGFFVSYDIGQFTFDGIEAAGDPKTYIRNYKVYLSVPVRLTNVYTVYPVRCMAPKLDYFHQNVTSRDDSSIAATLQILITRTSQTLTGTIDSVDVETPIEPYSVATKGSHWCYQSISDDLMRNLNTHHPVEMKRAVASALSHAAKYALDKIVL